MGVLIEHFTNSMGIAKGEQAAIVKDDYLLGNPLNLM
jgi:hypothetical protein